MKMFLKCLTNAYTTSNTYDIVGKKKLTCKIIFTKNVPNMKQNLNIWHGFLSMSFWTPKNIFQLIIHVCFLDP